ncbi:uncharacterized protein LOC141900006 [Tubulanus polymorphus]|uniref:uncharacterized protein LOC141900006 n=1 Tax=Tubulanus polymorphus TaxID=672921 RepID=UPI003DA274F1
MSKMSNYSDLNGTVPIGIRFPEWMVSLDVFLMTIVTIISILGNALIISSFAVTKRLQTSSNAFIIAIFLTIRQAEERIYSVKQIVRQTSRTTRKTATKMRSIMTLFIAFLMLVLLFYPFTICSIINNYIEHTDHLRKATRVFIVISYCSTGVNPIVYGFMNKNFRRGYKNVLRLLCSWRRGLNSALQRRRSSKRRGSTSTLSRIGMNNKLNHVSNVKDTSSQF